MSETGIGGEERYDKSKQWRERIGEQERSGMSVKQFCVERSLTECSFYAWRKREEPVRFTLRSTPSGLFRTFDAPLRGGSANDEDGRCVRQNPSSQQFETGTPIHLAFDHLQPVDLSFDLTGAP